MSSRSGLKPAFSAILTPLSTTARWVRHDNIHGYVYGRFSQLLNVLSNNDGCSVPDRRVIYDDECRAIDKDLSLAEKAPFGLSGKS